MDRLETLIADTLREHAADAPEYSPAPGRTPRGPARSWLLAGAAAAVVAAVVITITALAPGGGHSSTAEPTPRTTAAPSSAPVAHPPAGQRFVSFGQVELTVPASYGYKPLYCDSQPTGNAVVPNDGLAIPCPPGPPIGPSHPPTTKPSAFTVVDISRDDPADTGPPERIALTPVTIDGVTGRRGAGVVDGQYTSVLDIAGVRIVITSPGAASATAILDSARIAAVDPYGCPARVASLVPSGNAPADRLVPADPSSAVVCEYAADRTGSNAGDLIGSAPITPGRLTQIVTELDSFQPAAQPSANAVPANLASHLLLRYPDGTVRVVGTTVHQVPLEASDGQHSVTAPSRLNNPITELASPFSP